MGSVCASGEEKPAVEQVKEEPAEPVEEKAPEAAPGGPKLTIMVMGARGLRNADWLPGMGTSDCYCTVKVAGKEDAPVLLKTKTINDTLTPIWQEEAEISDFNDGDDLELGVWDEDVGKRADSLGKVVLKSGDFASKGFNGELQLEGAGKNIKAFVRVKVKMAGSDDYPAGPTSEFTIKFDKDPKAKSLGLDVDETDGTYIYVINVKAGPFQAYNEKADVDKQLRVGDFLVSVNGKEGNSKEMLEELKSQTSFEIVAKHPEEICIAIKKKEAKAPLGLEFPKKLTGNALLITKVNDGPFKEWNDAEENYKVCDLDRVVSVAGTQGKAVELQKKMINLTSFQAIIVRPANTAKSWSLF